MKQKIEKWQRWIERIQDQLTKLMIYRSLNRAYERVVNNNEELNKGNQYLVYFRAIYADFAAMAIRRQARGHKDAVSLRDLLEDIAANPTALTRTWLREFYATPGLTGISYAREMSDLLADSTFEQFASKSAEHADPSAIQADIKLLEDGTNDVVTYADRTIAHDEKGGPKLDTPMTFNKIDDAIKVVEDIAKKYVALLTGASYTTFTPVDHTDAINVFRAPWLTD